MRRLIVVGLAAITLAVTNVTVLHSVGAQSDPGATAAPEAPRSLPGSFIDDIEVPYEVLDYVHMTYQGHAVVHAHKIRRGGQEVYRLQAVADEKSNQSLYLFYDMNWQLLGDEKALAPQPAAAENRRTSQQVEVPEPVEQRPVEDRRPNNRPEPAEDPEPEEPEDEPEEPQDPPDNSGPGNGNGRGRNM